MEEEDEEESSKVGGVILEEEGEEGEVEVVVVGISGRMEKVLVVKVDRGVVVSNILPLQTPKLLLPSFINMRSR